MELKKTKFSYLSALGRGMSTYIPLPVIVLLTYGLLALMDLHTEGILKATDYTLTDEDGMGYYDSPGGTEQMVMYPDDTAGAEAVDVERKEGERWMDFDKRSVEKPQNGWAKVDIGDGGAPLYVEERYVGRQTVRMFEGRQGEGNFFSLGTKNLPPVACMFVLGVLLYGLMLYPWWLILKVKCDTAAEKEDYRRKLMLLLYVAAAYFIVVAVLKFLMGYNIGLRWFASVDSVLLIILNVIVGIIGAAGLAIVLFRFYEDNVNFGESVSTVFRNFGVKGILLLTVGLYFFLIFLGVVMAIIVGVLVTVFMFKLFFATGGWAAMRATEEAEKVYDSLGHEMDEIAPGIYRHVDGREFERSGPGFRERGNPDAPLVTTPGE